MSHVPGKLMPNEKSVCAAKVHPCVFVPGALVMIVALISAMASGVDDNPVFIIYFWLGLYLLVIAHATRKATELVVTTRRVLARHGVIKSVSIELNHDKVESLVVTQGILGRLFGFGTISVNGTGGVRAAIKRIGKPLEFRKQAVAAVDAAQSADTLQSKAA